MYYHLLHDQQIKTIFWGGYIFTTRMNILSVSAAEKPNEYDSFSSGKSTFILRSVTLVFTFSLEIILISLS